MRTILYEALPKLSKICFETTIGSDQLEFSAYKIVSILELGGRGAGGVSSLLKWHYNT